MRIGIIGAGVSGLAAAWALSRQGHHVEVFERSAEAGGLISTFDFDGARVERYYHFLCKGDQGYFDLCADLGIDKRIRWVKARTGFYYDGREYPFTTPLDLLRFNRLSLHERIRFGLFALESRMRNDWMQLDEIAAKPWLIDRIGRHAYEMIWHPLIAMKFGERHKTLSAAWVWHRVHRVAQSKGWIGYLDGGSGYLLDVFTARLRSEGVPIHEGRAVKTIRAGERGIEALEFDDGTVFDCDHVISTVPLCVLSRILPLAWSEYSAQLAQIEYIGVVCAVFKLGRPVTGNFWLNIHDPRIACNGIIEYTNLNSNMGGGASIVYVPYYTATDRPVFRSSDNEVFEQSWKLLRLVNPELEDGDLLGWRVSRAPHAQAVCPAGFLAMQPKSESPLMGLHLLDSTFLYPEDRTQAGLIVKARECAVRIGPA